MSITLSALQKQRRDTAANWTSANPTLLAGEIGIESDTGYWKVGDGSTVWNSLAYLSGLGGEIPVSRLADGSARQLLQTAANGNDVEWTSNVDIPGTLDVTSTATFDSISQHPLGAAATPSITFTGDTNTGIYSPGADQVAISTGGSGRLFVDATGNVGVGAVSDTGASKLFIAGNGTAGLTNIVTIRTSSANSYGLQIKGNNTNDEWLIQNYYSAALAFGTSNTERLRITSAGLVGVGTSAPSTRLHVLQDTNASQLRIESTSSGNRAQGTFVNAHSQWDIGIAGGTTGQFLIATATENVGLSIYTRETGQAQSEKVTITAAGRLGIGTSTPSGLLHLQSSGAELRIVNTAAFSTSPQAVINFGAAINSGGTTTITSRIFGGKENATDGSILGNLSFHINNGSSNVERMRIDSSGRLGIGTSSPGSIFHAVGNGAIGIFQSTTAGQNAQVNFQTTVGTWSVGQNINLTNTGALEFSYGGIKAVLDSSGRLGIGTTSPVDTLQVNRNSTNAAAGAITIKTADSNESFLTFGVSTSLGKATITSSENGAGAVLPIAFTVGSSSTDERMRIDTSGRLLVGTSSGPSAGLGQYSTFVAQGYVGLSTGEASISLQRGQAAASITSGTGLGYINFNDNAGYTFANISAFADANAGTNDYPGRLVFSTTADGSASPTERFRISSDGSFSSVIPGGSTLYPQFACRAWVNFNGTGTVAIRGSGNVSSITDNGTGNFTVNFTTAMPDANYTCAGMSGSPSAADTINDFVAATGPQTGSVRFGVRTLGGAYFDANQVHLAIFR